MGAWIFFQVRGYECIRTLMVFAQTRGTNASLMHGFAFAKKIVKIYALNCLCKRKKAESYIHSWFLDNNVSVLQLKGYGEFFHGQLPNNKLLLEFAKILTINYVCQGDEE